MPKQAAQVLIIGGGPVGLTMAAALHHHGVSCRIIDKAPAPSDKSKALAVWCRTMELLDGLGLAETFVRTGLKLTGGSIYAAGTRVVHLNLTSDESPFGFPLMIPQNETERLLAEHLARQGISVERQVELVTFQESPSGVQCTLRHADGREESFQTPWLIGCDGAHSSVRHTLGLEFTGHPEPNDWMLADAHIAGPLADDEVSVFWSEHGVLAFFPIDRHRFRMIADLGAATGASPTPPPTLAEAQAKVDERGPGGLTLSDPVWLANFRINERKVADYRCGRVMLCGDAAHIHSPAGGQGMNTGMQDAFNLAWKLALVARGRGKAEPLLTSYSLERSAVGDEVLKNAERFTTLATLRSPVAQWLRNHIVPILGSFHMVQDKIRDNWFELSINYRHSPLSAGKWPRSIGGLASGELAAGDRLCDAPLLSWPDRQATALFTAIRNTRHTLLLLPASNDKGVGLQLLALADDAEGHFPGILSCHLILPAKSEPTATVNRQVAVWLDATGRLHEKLNVRQPCFVLVRPDGYIGYRCQPADGEGLLAYLSSYLLAAGSGSES